MNKGLKEKLVKVEYHGQVWYEVRIISNGTIKQQQNFRNTKHVSERRELRQHHEEVSNKSVYVDAN